MGRRKITNTDNTDNNTLNNLEPEKLNYGLLSQMSNTNWFNNPMWQNEILKEISTLSKKYKRDDVLTWLENYKFHEQELMELNQYLLNSSQHFRRVADYFIEMLTFNYVLLPVDSDLTEKEIDSPAFKKCYKSSKKWFEKFNVQDEGKRVFRNIMEEDVAFYYKREDVDKITFQRLPSAWCKIVNRNAYGFTYAFNFMFFWRLGINIKDYPPEFEKYINDIEEGKRKDNYYAYWVTLDAEKAVAFKFNEETGIIKSPFMGLFLDVLEISEYKNLIKSRSVLDNVLLLTQKIPMNDKSGKKNDFMIELEYVKSFQENIAKGLPQGVKVISSPMELNAQKLDGGSGQSKQSIVGIAEDAFYQSGGVAQSLFGSKDNKNIGILQSIKVDESWVLRFYRQFERWINFQLRLIGGKYRFKVWFPDITLYNASDKADMFLKASQYGFPPQLLFCALGATPNDYDNMSMMSKVYKIIENMIPLQSSHTQNGNDEGGTPKKKESDLTPSGQETRANGDNIGKQVD